MVLITQTQLKALHRLARRLPQLGYELRFIVSSGSTGQVSITTRHCNTLSRIVSMVKRIVPEASFSIEHGTGWHTNDRTPYYHSSVDYMLR